MSDDEKTKVVNPLAAELKAHAKTWDLPVVNNESQNEPADYTNAIGKPRHWVYEPPEPEPEPPKPLTAEDIDAIRQSAYDDGFSEGKLEGIEKGIEEGREQGHAQGLIQGEEEGLAQGLEQAKGLIDEKVDVFNQTIEGMLQPFRQLDSAAEAELIELAVELARAVIKTEVQTNPDILLKTLKEAVSALPINSVNIEIYLHPEDLTMIKSQYDEEDLAKRQWHLISEPALEKGNVEVKTPTSNITYTIAERVSEILDRFLQDSSSVNT